MWIVKKATDKQIEGACQEVKRRIQKISPDLKKIIEDCKNKP